MKKFIINPNGHGMRLSEDHIQWLMNRGYSANYLNWKPFDEDRSNADLIACIEDVRAAKQHIVEKAMTLRDVLRHADDDAIKEKTKMSAEMNKLLAMLDINRNYIKNRVVDEIYMVLRENIDWDEATIYAAPRDDVSVDDVWAQLNVVSATYEVGRDKFQAIVDARDAFHEYCEHFNLRYNGKEIEIDDGFEIKTYDETQFNAYVGQGSQTSAGYDDYEYEFMQLKPIVSWYTLATFVDTGDTDGLFAYLKGLKIGDIVDFEDFKA